MGCGSCKAGVLVPAQRATEKLEHNAHTITGLYPFSRSSTDANHGQTHLETQIPPSASGPLNCRAQTCSRGNVNRQVEVDPKQQIDSMVPHAAKKSLCMRTANLACAYIADQMPEFPKSCNAAVVTILLPLTVFEHGEEFNTWRNLHDFASRTWRRADWNAEKVSSMSYLHTSLMWTGWAAASLGLTNMVSSCLRSILEYIHPLTGSGLVSKSRHRLTGYVADFHATAASAKIALLAGDAEIATAGCDSLLRALDANHENILNGRFKLRWSWADGFLDEVSPFHCVLQDVPGQMYCRLGLPAVVLLTMAEEGADRSVEYRGGALKLLAFLKGCTGLTESSSAAVVACAAAMANDKAACSRVLSGLALSQHAVGCFMDDIDSPAAIEEAAEVAFWLRQTDTELGRLSSRIISL